MFDFNYPVVQRQKEAQKAYRKQYHQRQRLKVLAAYSGGTPHCACCGETHVEFLAIDHINGNGHIERKTPGTKGGGWAFYNRLIKNKFPPGYRVLCHNCNSALGFYGKCPHGLVFNPQPSETTNTTSE